MAQRVRDILLRIHGDASDAQDELHDLATEVKDFGRLTEEAKVDLQTKAAEVKLDQLKRNLDNLQKKPVSPKVDLAVGRTVAQIEMIEGRLDKLDRRRVNIDIGVDRPGGLGRGAGGIGSGLSSAASGLADFVAEAGRGLPLIGRVGTAMIAMGASGAELGPIFIAAAAAAIPALVLLAGALFALTASAATAVLAVGALGVALAGVFTPVFFVGVAAMARLAKVMEAVNAEGKERAALLKALGPQEQRLARTLIGLKDTLTDIARPATNAIFGGLIAALNDLKDFAQDPVIRRGLTGIGRAVGDAFRLMGRELRRRETREAFADLAGGARRLIRLLSTDVFRSVVRTLLRLAREALPFLEDVIRGIARGIRNFGRETDRSDIEGFVRRVRRSFRLWKDIVVELGRIVKEFFGDAKDSGDKLAVTILRILRRFRAWLEENPDKITNFFKDAVDLAKRLAGWIQTAVGAVDDLAAAFANLKGPDLLENAAKASPVGQARQIWKALGFQHGGTIPGIGSGDIVPAMLEPGEFVLRRSVAQAIGMPRLHALNAGHLPAAGGGGGNRIHIDSVVLPPAPGHDQLGDPRHQAVMFAREMARRGGSGVSR